MDELREMVEKLEGLVEAYSDAVSNLELSEEEEEEVVSEVGSDELA